LQIDVKKFFLKEKTHPMPMKWTFYQDDIINIEPANNCNSITQESELLLQHVQEKEIGKEMEKSAVERVSLEVRLSGRFRKQPRKMGEDFLWSTH
jgi:hypothetical protein